MKNDNKTLKISDQIDLLEKCKNFTETGEWKGGFTYPGCGLDLVKLGLVAEDKKITDAGKAALWLLGKAEDPTDSKAVHVFKIALNRDVTEAEKCPNCHEELTPHLVEILACCPLCDFEFPVDEKETKEILNPCPECKKEWDSVDTWPCPHCGNELPF